MAILREIIGIGGAFLLISQFQVRWKVENDTLTLKHLFTRVSIPVQEIEKIEESETYSGPGDATIIGIPGRINGRYLLTTSHKKYLLAMNGYEKLVRDLQKADPSIEAGPNQI